MNTLYHGDCLEVMPTLEANSVDTIITDPPYGLSFMGKDWDHGVPGVAFWREALRVAKPGAMLLAFGGPRTFHRLTCAIEDAGWEVRDVVSWLYGQGFPKSADISKLIDKSQGAEREVIGRNPNDREQNSAIDFNGKGNGFITAPATPAAQQWHGWGTALKPAWEPVILAMKPLDKNFAHNALTWGVAGLNVDGARIGVSADDAKRMERCNTPNSGRYSGSAFKGPLYGNPGTAEGKPLDTTAGRWPANLLLDEDAARALDAQSGERKGGAFPKLHGDFTGQSNITFRSGETRDERINLDSGGASRYFHVVKVAESDFSMYNTSTPGGVICGLENTTDGATSAGRRTVSNGASLSTDGYGSNITGLFRQDAISITKTATLSTMTFPILSASTSTNIGTCIIESESDISWLTGLNLESVSGANDGCLSITFNCGQQALIKATARIVSGQHSQNGETRTASTLTPTCGNTTGVTSRFLYQSKASRAERNAGLEGMEARETHRYGEKGQGPLPQQTPAKGTIESNFHPTVKPLALMRYLCRLTSTPTGGVVLDPFMGSGTTGVAALQEGRSFVGIEREAEYVEIARRRIAAAELPLLREAAD